MRFSLAILHHGPYRLLFDLATPNTAHGSGYSNRHRRTAIIISLCEQAKGERIGGNVGGNLVIKVSGEIAVKCGYGVTSAEAVSYHHLDSSIVRVPRVYRFFQVQSFQTSPCKKVISLCSTSPARL